MFRYNDVSYQLPKRGKLVYPGGKVKTGIFEGTSNFSFQDYLLLRGYSILTVSKIF